MYGRSKTSPGRAATACVYALLAGLVPALARAQEASKDAPVLALEAGAAWQRRNDVQIPNEPPNTRFALDDVVGDGPFYSGRVTLDWPLSERHRLRFAPRWRGVLDFEGLAAPQGRAIDLALKVAYDATPRLAVNAGYRLLDGGADNDDLYTFARFDQAVLGVTWKLR